MKSSGFSLIELMVVVAIMGIIAAFAVPSYREYVASTRRAEAGSALLEGAQALERYYSANGKYLLPDNSALPAVFPTQVPANGTAYYTIAAVAGATGTAFTLEATRSGVMASDACGNLRVDQTGARTLDSNSSGKTVADCWRR